MSAIEVLKGIKKDYEIDIAFRKQVKERVSKERIKALDEAVLALEQKEKLKKWLNSEINSAECNAEESFGLNDKFSQQRWDERIEILKEVREFLK